MKFALVTIETEQSKRSIVEDRAKHRERIEAWISEQAQAGKLLGGEAFETEKTGPVTVAEQPFAGESATLGGFILVDVADRDEAVELAKSWPTAETIEVRPVWVAS